MDYVQWVPFMNYKKKKFYQIENIKSIHATSVGAFIGALLCLKMDWDILIPYFEKRPWNKIIKFTPDKILEIFVKKGIFGRTFFNETFLNILKANDLSLNITLKELYNYSNIELHIFCTQGDTFELADISYKTHPDIEVIQAVYQSCSIPFIFQPSWYKDIYYLDGGIINNYPVNICIQNGAEKKEILGIRYHKLKKKKNLTEKSNIFEFAIDLYRKLFRMNRDKHNIKLENEIIIPSEELSIDVCKDLLNNQSTRKKFIGIGGEAACIFLNKQHN